MANSHSDNRAKAPQSAAFVDAMREVWPDLKIERIREDGFSWGPDDTAVYATCFVTDKIKK